MDQSDEFAASLLIVRQAAKADKRLRLGKRWQILGLGCGGITQAA